MASLTAKLIKVFADIGATGPSGGYLAQFGSAKNGTKTYSSVQSTLQSLTEYEYGIKSALINGAPLAIQEIDALNYLLTSSAAYIQWYGIGRYNAAIEYFSGSFCKDDTLSDKILYISKIDNNINNDPSTSGNWMPYDSKYFFQTSDSNFNISVYELYREHKGTSATDIICPESTAANKGRVLFIWNSGSATKTIKAANSDTINGAATFSLTVGKFVKLISIGTEWQIIGKSE